MDLLNAHSVEIGWILVLMTFSVLWIYSYSLKLSSKAGVPKGRFWQLPFVGETLTFASGPLEHFLSPRIQRYGRNFRTHLLGAPTIVVTTFDQIKFVLQSPRTFKRIFTKTTRDLLAVGEVRELTEKFGGHVHRGLSRDATKKFIPALEKQCMETLAAWERMERVPLLHEVETFAFTAACIFNCDYLISEVDENGGKVSDKVQRWLGDIREGLITLPVNIPGFGYHKALKARKNLEKELLHLVIRRRAEKGRVPHDDLLDVFVKPVLNAFTDTELVGILIGFLFAAVDTSSTTLFWAIIELAFRPQLVALLREENDRLAEEKRRRPDDKIKFEDIYEKLTLTNQVVQETLRLHNSASFSVREATEEVVHEGMVFPKGCKVIACWVPLHKDTNNHSNPHEFNPSRFASESASKPASYMPFSVGPSACKGQDAFKVEAAILLHHLVAAYDFKIVGEVDRDTLCSNISPWPTPRPLDPLFITVTNRHLPSDRSIST